MNPDQENEQYYVLRGQQAEGPFSKEALFSMRGEGAVSDSTLICRVGDSQWRPMGEVFPSAKQAAPPPPPPGYSAPPPFPSPQTTPAAPMQLSQEDRGLLREYLVATFRLQPESSPVAASFKDALADAIPALAGLLGRREAVVAGTTVTNTDAENTKREALFQLRRLLDMSATYIGTAPWIPYLTAVKRPIFMECYRISTANFSDFSDKKLVDETCRVGDALASRSSALMEPTFGSCSTFRNAKNGWHPQLLFSTRLSFHHIGS